MQGDLSTPTARFAQRRNTLIEQLGSGASQEIGKVLEQVEWDFTGYAKHAQTREALGEMFKALHRATLATIESAKPEVFQSPDPSNTKVRRACHGQLMRRATQLLLCLGAAALVLVFQSPQGLLLAGILLGALLCLLLVDLFVLIPQRTGFRAILSWLFSRVARFFRQRSSPGNVFFRLASRAAQLVQHSSKTGDLAAVVSVRHDASLLVSKLEDAVPHIQKLADSIDRLIDGIRSTESTGFRTELCKPGFLGEFLQQLLGRAGRHHDQDVAALIREQLPAKLRMTGIRVEEYRIDASLPEGWFQIQVDRDQVDPIKQMEPAFLPLEGGNWPLLEGRVSLRE